MVSLPAVALCDHHGSRKVPVDEMKIPPTGILYKHNENMMPWVLYGPYNCTNVNMALRDDVTVYVGLQMSRCKISMRHVG